jgi:hypothetical protein
VDSLEGFRFVERELGGNDLRRRSGLNIEGEWQADEERAEGLLKAANRYVGALKAWKKACQMGHFSNRQKAATQAAELASTLLEPTAEASSAWTFDVREYLAGDAWREELNEAASKVELRLIEDNETLISSPVVVRSQPGRNALQIGKVNWPQLRPRLVVNELKRLRDRAAAANSQEFVESLAGAYDYLKEAEEIFVKFRDIYTLFSLTPGWKKENPPAAFGQAIYALHLSDVHATRGGRRYEMIYPSSNVKEKDVFTVMSEDGRAIRYMGIRFSDK